MLRTLVLAALLLCCACVDGKEEVYLWGDELPPDESGSYGPETKVPEDDPPTRYVINDITEPRFEVWPATGANAVRDAAVLVIPGGGYSCVSITAEGEEIAAWLNGLGLTAFILKYRVPSRPKVPNYWCAVEDAQRAAGMIRTMAPKKWGLKDGFKLGAIGFSAGGHAVATLAANPVTRLYAARDEMDKKRCGQDFTMLVYPAWIAGLGTNGTLEHPSSIVVPPKSETFPPMFGAQCEDDFCTPDNVMAYGNLARQRKAKAEVHVYPEGGHGYGLRPTQFEVCTWPQRAEKWLKYIKIIA